MFGCKALRALAFVDFVPTWQMNIKTTAVRLRALCDANWTIALHGMQIETYRAELKYPRAW